MILYLDTSAFIKLYVDEPGASVVRGAVGRATAVHTHWIAYPEMCAALARLHRMGRQTANAYRQHRREFETDWRAIYAIMPDERVLRRAGVLTEQFGLRGYDAVHLGAAESIWSYVPEDMDFRFGAFDQALTGASTALGMPQLGGE